MVLLIAFVLSTLLLVLNIEDVVLTNRALAAHIGAIEGNPIMVFLMKYLGTYWWTIKVMILPPVIGAFLAPGLIPIGGLILLNGWYGWAVYNNYTLLKKA